MHSFVNKTMKASEPLISVIVPIYNVELYVRKCLDSLNNQTVKEIEVICIDDGSTDCSGAIAQEYAIQPRVWPMIRVIHTENRGLSAARNRGIEESRAPWLMFVDSDDWVDEDFCRIPYEAAVENNADLVIFGHYRTNEKGRVKKNSKRKSEIKAGIIDKKDVILEAAVWNKLYKRELFNVIRYPEGKTYEDVATTHKLLYKAQRICYCKECLYFYRRRKGSISRSSSSRIDEYTARIQQYKDLIDYGYPRDKAEIRLWKASLAYCGHAATTIDPLYKYAAQIVDQIEGIPRSFSYLHKMMLFTWKINRHVYRIVYWILGKRMENYPTA